MFLVLRNLLPITGKGSNFAQPRLILLIWHASNAVGDVGRMLLRAKPFSESSEWWALDDAAFQPL